MKIGIFMSTIIEDSIKDIFKDIKRDDIEIEYIFFKDFKHLDEISKKVEDNYDGFLAWGALTEMILKESFKESTYIRSISMDPLGLSKTLLKMYIENPGIDLSEVYIDFLVCNVDFNCLKDVVDLEKNCYTSSDIVIENSNHEDFDNLFLQILNRHIYLHKNKKVKVSITHCLNTVLDGLKKNNIKYYFCYPSKEYIIDNFNLLVKDIEINNYNNSQASVIQVTVDNLSYSNPKEVNTAELKYLLLEQSLMSFSSEYNFDFMIRKNFYNLEILTHYKDIKKITDNFTKCSLISYLSKVLNFNISIGYGIGPSLNKARENSFLANKEASLIKESCSFVMTSKKVLTGPFTRSHEPLEVATAENPYIIEISKETGLSPFTLSKIVSVMKSLNSNILTSEDLSYTLNITKRSANRFFSKLLESERAEIIESSNDNLRGRPKKKYKIHIDLDKV